MKHVLITGGSRGIGAATVELFAKEGYEVSFIYEKHHEAAKAISEKTGASALCCDVADGQGIREAIASIPPVDILINNAGISKFGLISQLTSEEWDRIFAVNVKGVYHCVNAVLPAMLEKKSGCILNISSMWGQVGASCEVAYSATKGAILALTKALAQELGPSGIRVNAVSPGVILTDMLKGISPEVIRELAEETPVGHNGKPEDIAKALLYLAEADFVTGQNLPVNGGFVLT